jgi:uncharacterized protein
LSSLRAGRPGFGVCFEIEAQHVKIEFEGLGRVSVLSKALDRLEVTVTLTTIGEGELVQSCNVVNTGTSTQRVPYRVGFGASVNRASYGQLTEGGPLPLPRSKNELQLVNHGYGFVIANSELGAYLDGMFLDEGEAVHLARKINGHTVFDVPIHASVLGELELPPESRRSLETRFRLRTTSKALPLPLGSPVRDIPKLALWSGKENQAQFIVRRNLEYILGNCTIPLPSASGVVCLITDHVALPLGWNRDN